MEMFWCLLRVRCTKIAEILDFHAHHNYKKRMARADKRKYYNVVEARGPGECARVL